MASCPFCNISGDVLARNEHAVAIADRFPVSHGHCLVIPIAHVETIFDLSEDSYIYCFGLLRDLKEKVQREHRPTGFNVGVNCGSAAGQTIQHAHIHLIPRYSGDVPNPRGGVRNVIPGRGDY